jgi:hypothetical protein
MSKLGMLAAGAVGYVLGARAGRERYDQIVDLAQRIWTNPQVQRAATDAQERAREAAPVVAEKVADAAKHAAGAAVSAVRSGDGNGTSTDAQEMSSGGTTTRRPRAAEAAPGPDTKVSHL